MSCRRFAATCALLLWCKPAPGMAIDCHATGGHREGQPAWTVRHVSYADNQMIVSGDFGERYVLTCAPLNPGLICHGTAGGMEILVLINGAHMLESISESRSGREQLGHSYFCNGAIDAPR